MKLAARLTLVSLAVFNLLGCDGTTDYPANVGGAAGAGASARSDAGPRWDDSGPGGGDGGPWSGPVAWVDDDDLTCGGHSPCFSALGAAVSTAPTGSTIIVREGFYEGVDLRDKVVRIMSESGPAVTTLSAQNIASCIVARDSTVWISGFTMRNCGNRGSLITQGYGLFLGGSKFVHAHIEGNVIEQNQQGGIFLDSGSAGFLADIEIVGNRVTRNVGPDGAIKVALLPRLNHGLVLIANNILTSNAPAIAFAQDTVGATLPNPPPDLRFQIVNNTIVGNQGGLDASTWNVTLANNIFWNNRLYEINRFWAVPTSRAFNNIIGDGQAMGANGNFLVDPLFVDPTGGDYHLLGGSPAANRGSSEFAPMNDFDGLPRTGAPDVGAFELGDRVDEPPIRCGDGIVSNGPVSWLGADRIGYETCDDGNAESGDGCNDLCQWEARVHGRAGRPGLIGASDKNVCVLRADESVRCWGASLGPTPPGQYLAVAAATSYACAIRKDGRLACWNISYAALPVPPGSYKHIVATNDTTCAIDEDGSVICWVAGTSSAPVRYAGPFIDFAQGGACGLGADGHITCVNATAPTPTDSFVQVVAGGGSFGCGLRSDGTTACWAPAGFSAPRVPLGTYVRLSYGYGLAVPFCGLRSHGGMTCGGGSSEALQNSQQKDFMEIAPNGLPCGITVDRRVNCWGLTGAEYPHE